MRSTFITLSLLAAVAVSAPVASRPDLVIPLNLAPIQAAAEGKAPAPAKVPAHHEKELPKHDSDRVHDEKAKKEAEERKKSDDHKHAAPAKTQPKKLGPSQAHHRRNSNLPGDVQEQGQAKEIAAEQRAADEEAKKQAEAAKKAAEEARKEQERKKHAAPAKTEPKKLGPSQAHHRRNSNLPGDVHGGKTPAEQQAEAAKKAAEEQRVQQEKAAAADRLARAQAEEAAKRKAAAPVPTRTGLAPSQAHHRRSPAIRRD